MKRIYILGALLALFAGSAGAVTDSFTAPGHTTVLTVQANGSALVAVQALGTGAGLSFAAYGITPENIQVALPMIPVTCGPQVMSASANGNWVVATSGYQKFQVVLASISGGTETINTNGGTPPGYGCSATAPGSAPQSVTIDQTTPGTTNGVVVNNLITRQALDVTALTGSTAATVLAAGHAIHGGHVSATVAYCINIVSAGAVAGSVNNTPSGTECYAANQPFYIPALGVLGTVSMYGLTAGTAYGLGSL